MASQIGTQNLLAGIAFFSIDGTPYDVVGKAGYSVSTVKRETVSGMSGVQGFKETPVPGYIVVELRDSGGLTVADLNAVTASTIVLQIANGKTVMAAAAWQVDEIEVDSMEGTLSAKFESKTVTEI
jgi:hypothetical protein